MKRTEPKLEPREEQHDMGIRTQVPMRKLTTVILQLLGEIFAWSNKQGIFPAGAPFIRYHFIDTAGKMDVELGIPVTNALSGDDRVKAGVLPTGQYASLLHTGE